MPSLKQLLDTWAQRIGKPKSAAEIEITPPLLGNWDYVYIAPANGRVRFFAGECMSFCITNVDTGEMHYLWLRGFEDVCDISTAVECKKGDSVNIYYNKNSGTSPDLRCFFIPDEGSS